MADNDPFFDSQFMTEGTSRVDLIHNEFVARIKASIVALDGVDTNTPPGSPNDFSAYLIGAVPTGFWAGQAGKIAVWINGWKFLIVKDGFRAMVLDATSGQAGRQIDFFSGGWSSFGGVQQVTPQNLSGTWTARWDLKFGQGGRMTIGTATTVIEKPSNIRHGRMIYLKIKQDATGGRLIQFKAGEWLVPGAGVTQPTSTANAETMYTFIQASPTDPGPTLVSTVLNVVSS